MAEIVLQDLLEPEVAYGDDDNQGNEGEDCIQQNDPELETFVAVLPEDGEIVIRMKQVYKPITFLFPVFFAYMLSDR